MAERSFLRSWIPEIGIHSAMPREVWTLEALYLKSEGSMTERSYLRLWIQEMWIRSKQEVSNVEDFTITITMTS